MTVLVPDGEIDVYKRTTEGIVALRIPREARRSSAGGRKCRAEWAVVLSTPNHAPAHSLHDASFVYREGETVRPSGWCEDRWEECAGGIHFFLTRDEAAAYG